jgi:hypothetical protein
MTEISHVQGSGNVVADALNRYPEETGLSYDHLLPDEHDMDLVCAHFFNLSSGLCDGVFYRIVSFLIPNPQHAVSLYTFIHQESAWSGRSGYVP